MENRTLRAADPSALLEENLPLVESVVADVARRYRLRDDARDEFRSLAFLKLIEHDYAALRRFAGASSLRTYLAVVLQRVLLDHRNREWGRWRASAAATRLGPTAVRLERLVLRDGLTPGEAIAALGARESSKNCADLLARLKPRRAVRGPRAILGEEAIPDSHDPASDPELGMQQREQAEQAAFVGRAVREALRALSSEDHLLVTLHFRDGLTVADAARVMKVEPKPLYRRLERILAHLQDVLCTDELRGELARELAGGAWHDESATGELGWWRTSNRVSDAPSDPSHLGRDSMPRRQPASGVHRRLRAHTLRGHRTPSM